MCVLDDVADLPEEPLGVNGAVSVTGHDAACQDAINCAVVEVADCSGDMQNFLSRLW